MLSAESFNAMINQMGQDADWRRGYDCPCRDVYSGAADPACPVCGGKGLTWGDAVTGRVGVAGQKVQQEWAKMGMYESGDMVLTLPSDSPIFAMGEFDRLVMVHSSVPFSRVLTHTGSEKLPLHVEQIERVFWLAAGVVVDGGIPSVAPDGSLTWPPVVEPGDPTPPPNGAQYSMTGRRRPEYFAFRDFPQDRAHYGGIRFPRRIVVRLMDLFAR